MLIKKEVIETGNITEKTNIKKIKVLLHLS